ncbi:glycine/D-amino acid oxidase-like deaminating enzyme [Mucilaginibacter gracilis]|uniref:Glycine/D-amino acid oxidase-like deaminating enzyme n=1 Tax=Mucilaginibacter gracilis TaxID=423350 RepID=A0A495IXD4_9SPHI|nr:FAD-dependent oxidoreductase [Mucilaginibacter gracilis]RKR81356.1 glycine/D-amino acid oxidase-like deaminating enzyme [Mucilaginibacter gracilis]
MLASNTFSYWEQTAFLHAADVIIIGSGIVGLSAALHLKALQPQLKVMVLERGFLPSGASTKNAGFACFGTVSEQLEYLEQASEDEVLTLAQYKWRGLQRLRQNLGDAHINYQQHGGYELFLNGEESEANNAIEKLHYLNKILQPVLGITDNYSVTDAKIAAFGFKGVSRMIYNTSEGQIDTGKMMRTLLAKVQSLGVLVLNSCHVNQVLEGDNFMQVLTAQGSFKCNKVIIATNAFAQQLFPQLAVVPGRGQVLVTKPVAGLKLKGTYHFNQGYYYFRNIDGRVLFGGGRNLDFEAEQTWHFGHTEKVKQQLTSYLTEVILPHQHFEIDYWWSGIMGFGEGVKPIIKQVQPNVFCAVKCNGMGVAMGSLVGEEVAELALNS